MLNRHKLAYVLGTLGILAILGGVAIIYADEQSASPPEVLPLTEGTAPPATDTTDVAPLPQPTFAEQQQAEAMLQLSLALDKTTYKLGEKINATCTLTNPSPLAFCVSEPARALSTGEVSYEIRNMETQEVLPQRFTVAISGPYPQGGTNVVRAGRSVTLQPGEHVSSTYDLTQDYLLYRADLPADLLAKPGRYVVKAIYDYADWYLVSNEVTFEIVKP
jgi:hypothetical protein